MKICSTLLLLMNSSILEDSAREDEILIGTTPQKMNNECVGLVLFGLPESLSWQTIVSNLKEELAMEVGKNPQDDAATLKLK